MATILKILHTRFFLLFDVKISCGLVVRVSFFAFKDPTKKFSTAISFLYVIKNYATEMKGFLISHIMQAADDESSRLTS